MAQQRAHCGATQHAESLQLRPPALHQVLLHVLGVGEGGVEEHQRIIPQNAAAHVSPIRAAVACDALVESVRGRHTRAESSGWSAFPGTHTAGMVHSFKHVTYSRTLMCHPYICKLKSDASTLRQADRCVCVFSLCLDIQSPHRLQMLPPGEVGESQSSTSTIKPTTNL